jgi:hypothetical protein
MDPATHNKIISFTWGIADDVLRDLFKRGTYPAQGKEKTVRTAARAFLLCLLVASPPAAAQAGDVPKDVSIEALPPSVVRTIPQCGDDNVDPSLRHVTVTFSKDMKVTGHCWSWCGVDEESFPKCPADPQYLEDKRTCVLNVTLEPQKTYAIWINTDEFHSFQDLAKHTAVPYLLVFRTGKSFATPSPRADSAAIAKLYFDQGVDEYEPGRLDSALVMFNLALRWDSLSAPAWQAKGATLARMNRHVEAQTAFDVALRIRPDYLTAWWHRGCDNAVAGRVDEALSDLRHAIAIDSTAKSWPLEDACWDSLRGDSRLRDLTR